MELGSIAPLKVSASSARLFQRNADATLSLPSNVLKILLELKIIEEFRIECEYSARIFCQCR